MEIINDYIKAAIEYSSYDWNSDPTKVNEAHHKIIKAFKILRRENKLNLLKDLLNHENEGVVLWASTHLLIFDEPNALQSLKKIIKENQRYSFSSEMVIREWDSGRLTLEYPNE